MLKSDANPSEATLGSSGGSQDQPISTVDMDVVLALEILGQEQRPEWIAGKHLLMCVTQRPEET